MGPLTLTKVWESRSKDGRRADEVTDTLPCGHFSKAPSNYCGWYRRRSMSSSVYSAFASWPTPRSESKRVQNKLTSAVSPVTQCDIFSFSFELSALDANAKKSTERPHLEEVKQRERTWQVWLYSKYLPGFSPNLLAVAAQQATLQVYNKDILEVNKDVLRFNGEKTCLILHFVEENYYLSYKKNLHFMIF